MALLIETSRGYGRGLLRGVTRYHHEHGDWSVFLRPHGQGDPPPPWLRTWHGDGILARVGDRRVADAVLATGVPDVELRGVLSDLGMPFIGVDNHAVAKAAFDHLRERGFRNIGFCGTPRFEHPLMDARCDSLQKLVSESGGFFSEFTRSNDCSQPLSWEDEQGEIARWLCTLPKPVGIAACNDDYGLQVLDACLRADLLVPDQVAVIGIDNDKYLCGLAIPPLTSVDVAPERIGYEAAKMLDRMMDGEQMPASPILLPPCGVVTRQSTDVLATDDEVVVLAASFIRAHACNRISRADVMRHVQLTKTCLESRFKEAIGRSVSQEIQRVQIERAKELLLRTDLPIKQVAALSGFNYVQYMTRTFRQIVGQTPAKFRKSAAWCDIVSNGIGGLNQTCEVRSMNASG